MEKILVIFYVMISVIAILAAFPEGLVAMGITTILSSLVILGLRRLASNDADFLVRVFLAALVARLLVGLLIHIFDLREVFGGDALSYDFNGSKLMEIWSGTPISDDFFTQNAIKTSGSGWGMNYFTGAIYFIFGKNIFAAQSFCAVIGAATAPLAYLCSYKIFNNSRVGKTSAWLVALFPAFIIWSSQLLKDGLIIFLLVLTMIMVLKLQEKLNYGWIIVLLLAVASIITLRFYIFYMVVLAVVGAFIIGQHNSVKSILQRLAVLGILGLSFTYLGVIRNAGQEFENYGSLEKIQLSRSDLAKSANSGFGSEADVSTTEGAISQLPIGFIYLIFAPFPWQFNSFRSAITLPEMLFWWSAIPFLVTGIIYSCKNRLRKVIPVLTFTLMLTLAYSLFQGNVGTAYRQRTQIQVFLFMFIAVGWTIRQEKLENIKSQGRKQGRI